MGTITDKLTYLGQTKAEIRNAIQAKGVTVPAETTFREYAGKISEITAATNPVEWTRPADWLPIESKVKENDQKLVGLHAIFEDSNFVSLSATGNYTVDWGDGLVENFTSGTQAYHSYSYSAFAGTESSRGYRQAIVTITPQAGQNLTNVNLQKKHRQAGLNSYSTGWLDVRMSGPKMTGLVVGGTTVSHRALESFCFLGNNVITDFSKLFQGCSQLQSVIVSDTSRGTNFANMFSSCTALKKEPLLNTTNGMDFSFMFESCASLQTITAMNTSAGTNFSGMFYGCSALKTIPLLDTSKGTDFSAMFSLNTALESIPVFNTSGGTSFVSMFESCTLLKTIPLLDTAKGVDFSYMLQDCAALETIPVLNTANGTDFSQMFFGCVALQTIPVLNISGGTAFSGMFTNCGSLSKVSLSGTKNTISYASCKLSRTALVTIFNNLASGVTSKTITITNNWGAASLSAAEKAIATGKGWTIVG